MTSLTEHLRMAAELFSGVGHDQNDSTDASDSPSGCDVRVEREAEHVFLCTPMPWHMRVGRPRINITQGQLKLLTELGFSWVGIAEIFGVSARTIT